MDEKARLRLPGAKRRTSANTGQQGTFQTRVMNRVRLVVIAAMAIVALLTIVDIQIQQRRGLSEDGERGLRFLQAEVNRELEDPLRDLESLAASNAMRNFAESLTEVSGDFLTPQQIEQQTLVMSGFENILSAHRERYLGLRFLTPNATKWAEVSNFNGDMTVDVDIRAASLTNIPEFVQAQSAVSPGEVFIGAPIIRDGLPVVMLYAPISGINNLGATHAILQMEISLETIESSLSRSLQDEFLSLNGQRWLLVVTAQNRHILSAGEQNSELGDVLRHINNEPGEFINRRFNDGLTVSALDVANISGSGMPWRVIAVDNFDAVITETNLLSLLIGVTFAVTALLLVLLLNVVIRPLLRPLGDVSSMANALAQQNTDNSAALDRRFDAATLVITRDENAPETPSIEAMRERGDEIGTLVNAMGAMSNRVESLNRRIHQQTKTRSRDLDLASRLGRALVTVSDMDTMLDRAVALICSTLGYTHGEVYIVDDIGMNALMTYGPQRKESGDRVFDIMTDTPPTNAIRLQQPVIVPVVTPQTFPVFESGGASALAALPLIVGERVVGALVLYSAHNNAFPDEDLSLIQLLTDQLASGVYNARVARQTTERVERINSLNRQLTRASWEDTDTGKKMDRSFRYNLHNVSAVDDAPAAPSDSALSVPISIRGESIGALTVEPDASDELTSGDAMILQAVAGRVALAIENARLFQETQASLSETSTLYQLSRYLNEANSLQEIVEAIIVSVMPESNGGQVWVFDEYSSYDAPSWIELQADYAATGETNRISDPMRLNIGHHGFLQNLHENRVTLVNDIDNDTRFDPRLRSICAELNARAMAVIPLIVRGVWRGVVTITFDHVRSFSERESGVYSALIDQAGVAIDNRLLLRATEDALARNENLYAASRIINQAQNAQELVYAVVATASDPSLQFSLALFEGDLDPTGWPSRFRLVAQSAGGIVHPRSDDFPTIVEADSPMRRREPEIWRVESEDVDDENSSTLVQWMHQQGYRFMAVFPLFSANQPIALFTITSHREYEMSAEDYEVYRALTGQMSTQLQIRNLLERTEQALDETRRLYMASRAIASATDATDIYRVAREHLTRPFAQDATQGTAKPGVEITFKVLMTATSTGDSPQLEVAYAWNSELNDLADHIGQRLDTKNHPYKLIVQESDDLAFFGDVAADTPENALLEAHPQFRQHLIDNRVASMAAVPVQSRLRWFGVLVLESKRKEVFGEQYQRFLLAVADQVSIAIENKQLFLEAQLEAERAQTEARRALALVEASQFANRIGGDLEASLNEVFERVAKAAGFDRWMLGLLDQNRERLDITIAQMPGVETIDGVSYNLDTHIPMVDSALDNACLIFNAPDTYERHLDAAAETFSLFFGKHIAAPVSVGGKVLGSIALGRGPESEDLDARDEELVNTLAAQVAVALENRRLFAQAEIEQRRLRSIVDTMPAGIMVLDPHTLQPILHNDQAEVYLGHTIDPQAPFDISTYNLFRTGTNLNYPQEEMPIFIALQEDLPAFSDDVAIVQEDRQVDLMVNAAPIHDTDGNTTAIVAAFQDISNLRSLENTLQENLRETVALYEAQRQLAGAGGLDEVLDVVLEQLFLLQPDDGVIISANGFTDDDENPPQVERYMMTPLESLTPFLPVLDPYDIVVVHDIDATQLDSATHAAFALRGIRSFISVPMRTRQRSLGWVLAMNGPENVFSAEQERVLSQLGDLTTTAVDNRLLITSQQKTVNEIGVLYNATATISRTGNLDQLAVVMQAAVASMEPATACAYLNPGMYQDHEGVYPLFTLRGEGLDDEVLRAVMLDYRIPETGLFIEDIHTVEQPDELTVKLRDAGVQAIAATNLRVKDQPGGRIFLAFTQPRKFTESENRYLNTVTDSASVVVDNILLFDQIQSTLEQTSILYQASRALTDAVNEADILDVVVDYLIHPQTNQAFVGLLEGKHWDSPGASIRIAASWTADDSLELTGLSMGRDQFPAWDLLATDGILAIDDIETDDRLGDVAQIGIDSLGVRSVVVMPLRVASRAIGVIWLGTSEPQRHAERELRTYQSFAEQASLSLEASYLLSQTERRARQLQTSADVSESASQILDLEVLLPRVVDLIKRSFEYDHVQVFLMDERDEWAVLRASTGEAGEKLLSLNHRLAKGSGSVIGQVTAQAIPQIALDTADADVVHEPNPHLPMTRSEMALPLIIKGEVAGALDVQSNLPNAFSEEDVSALTTLAAQISVAIDNANNYAATQKQAERMSFLFDTTTAAASAAAESLDEALDTVTKELFRTFESTTAMIYLPQRYVDQEENKYTMLTIASLVGSDQPLSEIEQINVADKSNLLSVVYQSKEPAIVDRISDEARYLPVAEVAKSAIIAPLSTGVAIAGIIVIENNREYAYDEDALRLLRALAGSLAAIVQSAQLLDQLVTTNEQLRELDRVKSDFLANMSHELRTPLNSIIGFSRVMLKGIDGPLTEMQEQDLTTIFTSGQHLLTLINDVLDQAKIASGKMEVKPELFEVKPLVEAVKSIGIGLVKDKPVNLNVEYGPGLGQVWGDETRTRQVLINLVSNAAKFTQEGQIILRTYNEVDPRTNVKMVRIDVVDSGIGIAEKDLPLLFEAFRQIDSSLTRTVGGTGLGLPIAKSLVEVQGGQMTVTSEVNVGSTFSITIPVEPPPVDESADEDGEDDLITNALEPDTQQFERPQSKPTNPIPLMSKATATQPMAAMPPRRDIVLIEDNRDMVDQFRRTLQREGFEVQTADHPAYAEAMVGNLRPSLVVMDVNFAGGQGWEILERLKSRDDTVDIPVIVVSLSDESDRALNIGAFAFVQRPFLPDDLVSVVLEAETDNAMQRVLIISDDVDEVHQIEELLKLEDRYRIYAGTGAEGMSLVARRRPDLIVINPAMVEMDGFSLVAELRSHPETVTIPLIVVGEGDLQPQNGLLEGISVIERESLSNGSSRQFLQEVRALLGG